MIQKLPKAVRVFTFTALAGILSLGFATANDNPEAPSHAGHHGVGGHQTHMRGGASGEALEKLLSGLNLTEAQRADIKGIVAKNRPTVRPLMDDAVSARMDLNAAITAPTPNESAIRAATERVVQAQTVVALQRAEVASEIRKVLTPDQQKMFDDQRVQLRDKIETRMHHGHGHGHGHDGKRDDRSENKSGAKGERSDDDSSSASKK